MPLASVPLSREKLESVPEVPEAPLIPPVAPPVLAAAPPVLAPKLDGEFNSVLRASSDSIHPWSIGSRLPMAGHENCFSRSCDGMTSNHIGTEVSAEPL